MRLSKLLPLLVVTVGAAFAAGCASHTANNKNHTVILGGLYESHEGAYDAPKPSEFPINSDKPDPGSKLTGNKVSILWGLITYRDQ